MSGRKLFSRTQKRGSEGGSKAAVRYTPCSRQELRLEDELDDIAVVSNAEPGQVRYGSGAVTANGPKVVPGIITSSRAGPDRTVSTSNTRLNATSPGATAKASVDSLKSRSGSKQSLIELVSSRFSVRGSKRFSRESFSSSYINRTQISELDIPRKTREARRREIRAKLLDGYRHDESRSGCRWTFVFDPAGRLCYYWSMVVSLAFLYNFWVIIYRCAFQEIEPSTVVVWFVLDYTADVVYALDIAFHFRTAYLEDGVLQTDSVKLRTHYLNSTTFYIDALCLLPLDFLYLSIGYNSILRCFRLVKIYRFWAFMDRTERHTNYPNVWRTASLIHYLLVCFHWNACLYHIISINHGFSEVFAPSRNASDEDVVLAHLQALYWCTRALTTIGDLPQPVNKGDYLFIVTQLLFGMFLFAAVLGHVANIVANVSAARKEFQAKLDAVKTYMRMRRVPSHIQNKVIKWFDYLWLTQKSSDEERSVCCLPDKLKAEIAIHVHLDTLKRVEIFQNTEAGFLCELVLRLRPVLFSPGDYICRKGEVGKDMYIVNKGRLQVVGDDGKQVMATLKAGSYFGEISILNMGTAGNRRTASVRSVGYSDLFVLTKKDMWDVLKEYPAARVRLEAIATKRLEKNRKGPLDRAKMMHALPTVNGMTLGRCNSTPGLVESSGRVSLQEMWLNDRHPPPRKHSVFSVGKSCTSPESRYPDTRSHTMDSVLSETSSEDKLKPPVPSIIRTSASPGAVSPNVSPAFGRGVRLTPSTLEASPNSTCDRHFFQSFEDSRSYSGAPPLSVSPSYQQRVGVSSRPCSPSQLSRDAPQDLLMAEIRRLRDRLNELEGENHSMSMKLSQQQWEVENRLAEIELQICATSSVGSNSEDAEKNQESAI